MFNLQALTFPFVFSLSFLQKHSIKLPLNSLRVLFQILLNLFLCYAVYRLLVNSETFRVLRPQLLLLTGFV